jgi:mannose-6-phosphate isomerase-like protein (cupin superfamily)
MNRFQRSLAVAAFAAAAAFPQAGGTVAADSSAGQSAASGAPAAGGALSGGAVTYLSAAEVQAGFSHGAVLVDGGRYMVHASRREGAGQAEVHALDTDIIYVLDGSATLVTGGTVVEGKNTAPDEVRGSSIAGGETRMLRKGDVIVVPNGTPHWFREVQPPLLYYVVKVR